MHGEADKYLASFGDEYHPGLHPARRRPARYVGAVEHYGTVEFFRA